MIWQIYVRYPGAKEDWASECYANSLVAVGWNNVGDLSEIRSLDELKDLLKRAYSSNYRGRPRSVGSDAGTLWRFVKQIEIGDFAITPDAKGKRYYIGKIKSDYFYQEEHEKTDTCEFLHRRRVKWLGAISQEQAQHIWGEGRIGSVMAVARVYGGEARLRQLVKAKGKGTPRRAAGTTAKPDRLWGRAAEERALKWLKAQGAKPKDVAHLNLGWDIECGDLKYEVKGRHSPKTAIRLSQNEYIQAKKHKNGYMLLVFTAPSESELRQSIPEKIPDPVRTRDWALRMVREYLLDED